MPRVPPKGTVAFEHGPEWIADIRAADHVTVAQQRPDPDVCQLNARSPL